MAVIEALLFPLLIIWIGTYGFEYWFEVIEFGGRAVIGTAHRHGTGTISRVSSDLDRVCSRAECGPGVALTLVNRAKAQRRESGGDSNGVGFGFGVVDKLRDQRRGLEKRNE